MLITSDLHGSDALHHRLSDFQQAIATFNAAAKAQTDELIVLTQRITALTIVLAILTLWSVSLATWSAFVP